MSLLGTIFSKIFPAGHPASSAQTAQPSSPQGSAQQQASQPAAASSTNSPAMQQPQGSAAAAAPVDVERILDDMAQKNPQKLNWRTSIVDLMKLLGIDSSLNARKTLAQELHYNGDTNDSAAMNIWLHQQVMSQIAQNGGKLPPDLVRH